MFENQTKGWHGSYSNAGRTSAEQYHMIINKDKIIYGKCKNIKIRGFSPQEEPDLVNDILTQQIDIFDDFYEKSKKLKGKPKEDDLKKKKKKVSSKDIKPLYISSSLTPTCTKYNPKLTYILKRSLSGPNWEKITGRIRPLNEVCSNDLQYSVSNDSLKMTQNNFVDMKYQTQRGPFLSTNDVRYRTDIPFELRKNKQVNRKEDVTNTLSMTHNNSLNLNRNSNQWAQNPSDQCNNKKYNTQFNGFISQTPAKVLFNQTKSHLIKAPDFKKTISRAYINYLHREKNISSPLNIPNDVLVKNRTISMVAYDKSLRSNKIKKELRKMNLDPSLTSYLSNKRLNRNSQSFASAPNFNLMVSRPNDKGPLPFYMQQTCDRNSYYMISSKTLMMNNYANGKQRSKYDSFFPKKSYNKIINMHLVTSEKFFDGELNAGNILGRKLNKPISKVINYYRKNLDDNNTHEAINKFDSVTFKSIPRNNATSHLEKKRFEVDFNYY